MNVRSKTLLGLLGAAFLAAGLFGSACGEAEFTELTPVPTGPGTGATFDGVMEAITTEDCVQAPCHSATTAASGLNLGGPGADPCAVYDAIMIGGLQAQADAAANGGFAYNAGTVHPSNAQASFILTKPLEGNAITHGGGKQFPIDSDPGYVAILRWIQGDDGVYPGGGDDLLLPAGCGGKKGCGCSLEPASTSTVLSGFAIGALALLGYRRRR